MRRDVSPAMGVAMDIAAGIRNKTQGSALFLRRGVGADS